MRPTLLVCLALLAALLGAWTADAVGQVPGVTLPAVTVPTVTLPAVTLPSTDPNALTGGGGGSGGSGGGGSSTPRVSDVGDALDSAVSSVSRAVSGGSAGKATSGGSAGTATSGGSAGSGTSGGSAGSGTSGGSAGSGTSRSSSGSSASAGTGRERESTALREYRGLHASRRKFKNLRESGEPYGTTLTFWLARPATVRFVMRQEAPDCAVVGTFERRGHEGVNRTRFVGRYKGRRLPPGTYRITAYAVRGGKARSLGSVRVAIVPAGRDTQDARVRRSTCRGAKDGFDRSLPGFAPGADGGATPSAGATASAGATPAAEAAASTETASSRKKKQAVAAGTASSPREAAPEAADARREPRAPRVDALVPNPFEEGPSWLQALLLAALVLAILLLLAAAVPARALRPTSAAALVVDRRTDLALAAGLMFAAVAVATLVTALVI